MSERSLVKDRDGNITHVRETSDDGRRSWLYEHDSSAVGGLLSGGRGKCVEYAEHNENGTTDAWEYDHSFFSFGKGEYKGRS
jgi:hypothetical protein